MKFPTFLETGRSLPRSLKAPSPYWALYGTREMQPTSSHPVSLTFSDTELSTVRVREVKRNKERKNRRRRKLYTLNYTGLAEEPVVGCSEHDNQGLSLL
jgi:hypothetical protein